jgi:hypothetical protein
MKNWINKHFATPEYCTVREIAITFRKSHNGSLFFEFSLWKHVIAICIWQNGDEFW